MRSRVNNRKKKSNLYKRKKKGIIFFLVFVAVGVITIQLGLFKNDANIEEREIITGNKEEDNIIEDNVSDNEIKITSVGNIIIHDKQIKGAKTSSGYDFSPSFEYVKKYLKSSDLAIGIYEGNFNGGIPSGYPKFNAPTEVIDAMKESGLDIINYATNHVIDNGKSGVLKTITATKNRGLDILGVRENIKENNYKVIELKGHKIGLFSYTYKTHENNGQSINGIAIPSDVKPLINTFSYNDLENMYANTNEMIKSMKKDGVDFIIGSFHWGEEYETRENKFQREIAKKMNELGVDVILGGHPHVLQPYEILKNKDGKETFVSYSQGNFLSNQCEEEIGKPLTEDGIMIQMTLGEKSGKLYLKKYNIIPTWVYRKKNDNGLYSHKIIPVNEAIDNKEKFELTDDAYKKLKRSSDDTNKIVRKLNI